ncbi:hypothetical protein [Maribacter litoralis]|uniref:hypothetical protein n=1 Tax=Maribacter litoralis TaxID=2059726 RepID=UPI003F5CC6A3
MKNIKIVILITICFQAVYGQYNDEQLSRTFTYLSTGNSFTGFGNFASLSTTDNTLKTSLFFLNKSNDIWNIDIEAGATQGISSLFDEGKLNSNVSLGVEYRFLFNKEVEPYAGVNEIPLKQLDFERQKVLDDYYDGLIEILKRFELKFVDTKSSATLNMEFNDKLIEFFKTYDELNSSGKLDAFPELQKSILEIIRGFKIETIAKTKKEMKPDKKEKINSKRFPKLNKKVNEIDGILKGYENLTIKEQEKLNKYARSLIDTIRVYRKDLMKRTDINLTSIFADERSKLVDIRVKKLKEIEKKKNALKADYVRLNFFSVGLHAKNKNFSRFIDTIDVDKQLKKTNYTQLGFSLAYNFITNMKNVNVNNNKKITSFNASTLKYLTIGVEFNYDDNQALLEEVQVIDTQFIDEENNRIVNKSQNAYQGDYLTDLARVEAFVDYYTFLKNNENSIAIHLNPKLIFQDNAKPNSTMQFGVLIPFKKKDEETTKINLEIFYRWKDIFNTSNSTNSLLNRNIIGIQTAFPFNL